MILSVMVLVILTCCTTRGKYESMRRGLDSINQCNRSDLSFSVQDVKPYVNFFDKHGKPNDQLLAHYLLGRAYYESHEAPMVPLQLVLKINIPPKAVIFSDFCCIFAMSLMIFACLDLQH